MKGFKAWKHDCIDYIIESSEEHDGPGGGFFSELEEEAQKALKGLPEFKRLNAQQKEEILEALEYEDLIIDLSDKYPVTYKYTL